MNFENIHLDHKSRIPLYIQIKDQIKQMIANDLLPEGKRLLPTRKLAEMLEVNRTTVVSAYNELAAEGFIDARVGSGSIVKKKNRAVENGFNGRSLNWSEFFGLSSKVKFHPVYRDLISLFGQEDTISFGMAYPDPLRYPIEQFRKILNRLLREKGRTVFQISSVKGYLPLREYLAESMTREGNLTSPEDIMITSGGVQGLYLVMSTLVNPGDLVVVESSTAMNILWLLQILQAKVIDIPMDNQGMRVDYLENLISRQNVKSIYTIPTFQNPSGKVLSLERRKRLLDISQKFQIPVIEDDPYSRIYFDKVPPPSLKSLDRHGNVIYIGTFSKILFPGLRLGWLAAPHQAISQLVPHKQLIDMHTNTLMQHAVYEYCRHGLLEKHIQKMRIVYTRRRDLMISALGKYCADFLEWDVPEGGYNLWCRMKGGLRSFDLLREAIFQKVAFIEGKNFSSKEGQEEWLRLNFSYVDESLIEEGIRRLGCAFQVLREKSGMTGMKSGHL